MMWILMGMVVAMLMLIAPSIGFWIIVAVLPFGILRLLILREEIQNTRRCIEAYHRRG